MSLQDFEIIKGTIFETNCFKVVSKRLEYGQELVQNGFGLTKDAAIMDFIRRNKSNVVNHFFKGEEGET